MLEVYEEVYRLFLASCALSAFAFVIGSAVTFGLLWIARKAEPMEGEDEL